MGKLLFRSEYRDVSKDLNLFVFAATDGVGLLVPLVNLLVSAGDNGAIEFLLLYVDIATAPVCPPG